MNVNLLNRRQKMLKLKGKGFPLTDIVSQISIEYSITKQCVYRDWRRRKKWLSKILELDDRERLYLDILSDHREIARLASAEFLTGDNSSARIGALRLRRDLNKDLFFMLYVNELTERIERVESAAKEFGIRLED